MTGRLEIPGGFEPHVLDDFVVQVAMKAGREEAATVERRIRLLLQDKPSWLPEWAWRKILSRVLTVEVRLGR